eukprot:gnl/Spiro4/29236_TR14301_c0_g1_i1.p1 gnl/Spiro4/29236_TR14301_c0_g1~~gnl/Spiro4/29236_TR14301_c0_g1_i1.p1  ORF type:complete len:1062 (-),score=270.33 gnl/Spiro4/29236_TR14301_c0_g1_i1:87-2870(-)
MTVSFGQWPELPDFLQTCVKSDLPSHREVGFRMFASVVSAIGTTVAPMLQLLIELFHAGLLDAELEVKEAALLAVRELVDNVVEYDEQAVAVLPLVNSSIDAIVAMFQNGKEKEARPHLVDYLPQLMCAEFEAFVSCVPSIANLMNQVALNAGFEPTTRIAGLTGMFYLAEHKPNIYCQPELLMANIQVIMQLCTEADEVDDETADDPVPNQAAEVLAGIAIFVPSKKLYPAVVQCLQRALYSDDPMHRKAGYLCLASIAEGCTKVMRYRMEELMPEVVRGLQDPVPVVVSACLFALSEFSQYLQPTIFDYHASVLPLVFNLLDSTVHKVIKRSVFTLEHFILGSESSVIVLYLQPLMQSLCRFVDSSDPVLQLMTFSCIGAIAAASEQNFVPYLPQVIPMFSSYLDVTDNQHLRLRAKATESLGQFLHCGGREHCSLELIHSILTRAKAGFALEFSELNEMTYSLVANVCLVLKADFAVYLPEFMELMTNSLGLHDLHFDIDKFNTNVGTSLTDIDERQCEFENDTSVTDEKVACVHTLGTLARHCGAAFVQYIPRAMNLFKSLRRHLNHLVRSAVASNFGELLTCIYYVENPPQWVPGLPADRSLSNDANNVAAVVIPRLLKYLDDDDDEVVASAAEGLMELFRLYGPCLLAPFLEPFSGTVSKLLDRGTSQHDDDDDHDMEWYEALVDMLIAVARALGPAYGELHALFMPYLLKYAQEPFPDDARLHTLGLFGIIATYCGNAILPQAEGLVDLALSVLHENKFFLTNCLYLLGALLYACGPAASSYYPSIIQGISPVFLNKGQEWGFELNEANWDNAVAVLAKMILTAPDAVPIPQITPHFLSALPVKGDYEEAPIIYRALLFLYSNRMIPEAQVAAVASLLREVRETALVNGQNPRYGPTRSPMHLLLPEDLLMQIGQAFCNA